MPLASTSPAQPRMTCLPECQFRQVKPEDIGLNLAFDPKKDRLSDDIDVDIVTVHGLGAHPYDTWKTGRNEKGVEERWINWLTERDMLPARVPSARIWHFGYESQWFGADAIKTTASNIAISLLAELEDRRLGREYPIIFIAHSFGGLVVLEAICHAKSQQSHNTRWFEKFGGLIFFGTPFRGAQGMKVDDMKTAALSVYDPQDIEIQMLKDMQPGSGKLLRLVDNFCKIWPRGPMHPIMCYYEEKASEVGKVIGKERHRDFVVNEHSGSLDPDPSGGILKRGLAKDHFNINKFDLPTNMDFRHVSRAIADICDVAVKEFSNNKTKRETNETVPEGVRSRPNDVPRNQAIDPPPEENMLQNPDVDCQPTALGSESESNKAKYHTYSSIVYPSREQLPPIPLGRFVRGKGKPEGDSLDPQTPIPRESVDEIIYPTYQYEWPPSFVSFLCSLVSAAFHKRDRTCTHITTEQVTTYRLQYPGLWFKQSAQLEYVRKWLEESEESGCDVYFVTGYDVLKNPTITDYSTYWGNSALQVSMVEVPTEISNRREVRVFTRKGDHLCAVQYRQVRFSEWSRNNLAAASLAVHHIWEREWDMRGDDEDEEMDTMIAVKLQNELKLSENYQQLSFRDDEIFLY